MVTAYLALLGAIAVQRLLELRLSRRNTRWAMARGGLEFGHGQLAAMKVLHTAFLAGCAVEVVALGRPFVPALGIPMLVVVAGCQALRFWTMRALGPYWNTRVVVVPDMELVTGGPYRWLRHPNYVAVALEGIAIPMVCGAWITATVFTLANAWLLRTRVRCENAALALAATGAQQP